MRTKLTGVLALALTLITGAVKAETLTASLEQHYWWAETVNTDSYAASVNIPPGNTGTAAWYQLREVTTERWAKDVTDTPWNVTDTTATIYFTYPHPNADFIEQTFYDTLVKNWSGPDFATATCTTQFTTSHPYHTPSGPFTSPPGTQAIGIGLAQTDIYTTHQSALSPGITDFTTLKKNGRLRLKLSGFIPATPTRSP